MKRNIISTRPHRDAMKKAQYKREVEKFHMLLRQSVWDFLLMAAFTWLLLEDPWPPITSLGCFVILVMLFRSMRKQVNLLFNP
jgi:hypothetical protein